jgi:hypothetical protein
MLKWIILAFAAGFLSSSLFRPPLAAIAAQNEAIESVFVKPRAPCLPWTLPLPRARPKDINV